MRRQIQEIYWKLRCKKIPAYIHIPKTGGTYIAQSQSDRRSVLYPMRYLGHTYVVHNKSEYNPLYYPRDMQNSHNIVLCEEIKDYFVFATVRNIFDWLVSYAGHAGGWNPKYVDKRHYDYDNAQNGFEYLIKTIANREVPWPSRRFIFTQLFSSEGLLIVDWLNRTETLDQDLSEMANKIGAQFNMKNKQRVGKRDDYKKYYNDSLIEIVYKVWGRELKLFGYEFDGYKSEKAIIKKYLNQQLKTQIFYNWNNNKLIIKHDKESF